MIDNIPLGKNAAIVKIVNVLKEAAYVWRPTLDIFVIPDAVDHEIPWPIKSLEIIIHTAENSTMIRSPRVSFDVAMTCNLNLVFEILMSLFLMR